MNDIENDEPQPNPFNDGSVNTVNEQPKPFSWTDDAMQPKYDPPNGINNTTSSQSEGEQGQDYPHYPKPLFDYDGWTSGQREVNGRMQALFRGKVYDALVPPMSERFKPGFDPDSVPPSPNAALTGTGKGLVLAHVGSGLLTPFVWMARGGRFIRAGVREADMGPA